MKQNNKPTAYERKINRSRRVVQIVAILLAALMIGSVLLSALPVFGITKSEVDALKKKVNEASAKKKELKSQVSALSGDISSLEKQISLLDGQIEAQEDEIAAQEELLAQLEILVEEKTIELAASEEDQANQYARMKERVRYMVEHDSTSQLAILLASDSFADFLNRWEIVQQISVRDEKLFEELQAIRDKVTVEKQELEETQAEAIATKAQMDANKAELDAQHASKAKALNLDIPENVLHFVAENIKSSIRQLEGVINRLHGYSTIFGKKIDLELAQTCIHDIIPVKSVDSTVEKTFDKVCEKYQVGVQDITGKRRQANIVTARHVATYILRQITDLSSIEIARYFSQDHSSILSAIKNVEKKIDENPAFEEEVTGLIRQIRE